MIILVNALKENYQPTALTKEISKIPVLNMNDFMQYPIIQYMSNQENWTVSDVDKRPINVTEYMKTGKLFGASFKYGNPLTTLAKIAQSPYPLPDNRAYRFHAKDEQIIMIDVESYARDAYKKWALNFPCHYLEASKNNGLHVVLQVPKKLIPEKYHYLFEMTVFKHESTEFEIIFNNHYGTFTRRTIRCNYADFEKNQEQLDQLLFLLQGISKSVTMEQLEKTKKVQERIAYIEEANTEKLESFIDYIKQVIEQTIQRTKIKHTLKKYHYDESAYEAKSLEEIAKLLYRYYIWQQKETKRKRTHQGEGGFQELAMQISEEEFIYLIYMIGQDFLPPREKHQELRVGMPYLLYVAQRAWIKVDLWEKEKERRESKKNEQIQK